ncbi:MAG: glutamine-hydrolyzing carbamoyl-phosphate synthase small subunit [Planctomycetota bacterium]
MRDSSHGESQASAAARLVLGDGSVFEGTPFGAPVSTEGEVVFATGMVGYPESLTDPSYRGQILTLTYPLIGNYGVPSRAVTDVVKRDFESTKIHARALIVSTLSPDFTHWSAESSLSAWLAEEGIVGLTGVDTRALTKKLRSEGTVSGKVLVVDDPNREQVESAPFGDIGATNWVAEVSTPEPILHEPDGGGSQRVILVDCGAKTNIVRSLLKRGVGVLQVPWDHDFNGEDADGILVSNGPGDPAMVEATVANLRTALQGDRPLFGICMGNQLVGRAAGCETYKMKFGHRSQNQPCRQVGTERCFITSQNHGYALDGKTLPPEWEEWFVNANDGTNEGIRHKSKPFWTVQFHPEAKPGPEDTAFLFDEFVEKLR